MRSSNGRAFRSIERNDTVNKAQLQKNVGQIVKLQPAPVESTGANADDDWKILNVSDDAIDLQNERTGATVLIGLDGVYTYFSDPSRSTPTQKYGTLQLHVQVTLLKDGRATVRPLPPPRAAQVSAEHEIQLALESLRREHEFNEEVFARRGSNELGTPFSVDAIRRVLNSDIAARLGGEMHDTLLRARGAMDHANAKIQASLQFQKGSNAWAMAVNAASKAIEDTGNPLVTLRGLLRRDVKYQ